MSEQVDVREYIEALLAEKDRALAMADNEREKAAAALRGEQQRALDQASRERDKAAEALRIELARAMEEGDDRLREHITNQVMQIQAALVSAESLEIERLARSGATIDALAEKLEVVRQAAAVAQSKFEEDVRQRFANVNEFRDALDDLGKQMATRREMETLGASVGSKMDDLSQSIADLRSRIDVGPAGLHSLQQRADLSQGRQAGVQASTGMIIAGVGLVATILGVVIILANLYIGAS